MAVYACSDTPSDSNQLYYSVPFVPASILTQITYRFSTGNGKTNANKSILIESR